MIFNMLVILVYPKDAWNVLFDIFGTSDDVFQVQEMMW